MGETGVIGPDERVELLDGRLIPMAPIGLEHAFTVNCLDRYFQRRFGERAWVSIQGPIVLDDISEPQPDVMLTALPGEQYLLAHPTPDQALLIVEVSKSSLSVDRGQKLRAYARRGVREYWIVDLVHERIDVYREPRGERFADHRRAERGESVAPLVFPGEPIPVDDVLGPRPNG